MSGVSPRSETWTAYAYIAAMSTLLYGLGVVTPLLRDDLRLSHTVAVLHATALAVVER
jgi:hypothetical protein